MSHSSEYKAEFLLVSIFITLIEFMAHALREQVCQLFDCVWVVVSHRDKETYVVFRLEKVRADIFTKPRGFDVQVTVHRDIFL